MLNLKTDNILTPIHLLSLNIKFSYISYLLYKYLALNHRENFFLPPESLCNKFTKENKYLFEMA